MKSHLWTLVVIATKLTAKWKLTHKTENKHQEKVKLEKIILLYIPSRNDFSIYYAAHSWDFVTCVSRDFCFSFLYLF